MRRALARAVAPLPLALALIAAFPPGRAAAENGDRLGVSAYEAVVAERFHSIGADTLGLSYGRAYSGGVEVDFRVIDLPMGKGAKPAIHLLGGAATDERILGPATPGMEVGAFKVIDLSSGFLFELPLEAFLKGNAGVSLRVGWEGNFLLTRSGGDNFLTRSKARLDFVRTSGGLEGSSIGIGMGRDDVFGYDAGTGRWDVRLAIQGRLASVPAAPAAPAKPGAKPAPPAPRERLLWLFVDADVDTDGGAMADGLRARAGLGLNFGAFVTSVFMPVR